MYIIYVHFSKQAFFVVAVRLCFFDGKMALRDACLSWLSAPEGRFCAWQQARPLPCARPASKCTQLLGLAGSPSASRRWTVATRAGPRFRSCSLRCCSIASRLQHRDDVALNRPEDVEPGGTRAEPAEALANSEIRDVEPGGTRAGTRQFC